MSRFVTIRNWLQDRLMEKSTYIGLGLLLGVYALAPHIAAIAPVLPDLVKVIGGFLISAETKKAV